MRTFCIIPFLMACEPAPIPAPQPATPVKTELSQRQLQSTSASSVLEYKGSKYSAALAFDGDSTTAWCEGSKGIHGDWIEVTLTQPMKLAEIGIEGGFYRTNKTLIKNGRVRKMTIKGDENWEAVLEFDFVPIRTHSTSNFRPTVTRFKDPKKAQTYRFTIDKADKGETTSDVCISEITLYTLK